MNTPIDTILNAVRWRELQPQRPTGNDSIPVATHEGQVNIAGFYFKVYQLSNGMRVFDADSVAEFLDTQ